MAMASPQQKFEAGIAKVSSLREASHPTTDLVNESWSALRVGIVAARKSEDLLDARSDEEMAFVLDFMLRRAVQKKSATSQVRECLRVLLSRQPWLAAVRACESLRAGIRDLLDEVQDAELQEQLAPEGAEGEELVFGTREDEARDVLEGPPPLPAPESLPSDAMEATQVAPSSLPQEAVVEVMEVANAAEGPLDAQEVIVEVAEAAEPGQLAKPDPEQEKSSLGPSPVLGVQEGQQSPLLNVVVAAAVSEDGDECHRPVTIRERLAEGKKVLESFGWEFPARLQLDDATAGFMLIFDAVSSISRAPPRPLPAGAEDPLEALAELEGAWAGLLQFLVSMYTSGIKRTYSARIRFVTVELRQRSPLFRELAPWASLPWGDAPMPREEEEAEARLLEEFDRQRAEEAENDRLAQELQSQEEAEARALEDMRRRLEEEDLVLALKLEEQAKQAPAKKSSYLPQLPLRMRRRSAGGA